MATNITFPVPEGALDTLKVEMPTATIFFSGFKVSGTVFVEGRPVQTEISIKEDFDSLTSEQQNIILKWEKGKIAKSKNQALEKIIGQETNLTFNDIPNSYFNEE